MGTEINMMQDGSSRFLWRGARANGTDQLLQSCNTIFARLPPEHPANTGPADEEAAEEEDSTAVAVAGADAEAFEVGMMVEGRWKNGAHWYPGVIAEVHSTSCSIALSVSGTHRCRFYWETCSGSTSNIMMVILRVR